MSELSEKKQFTLAKSERLNGRDSISSIISNGEVVKAYPVLLSYVTFPSENSTVRAMFSVSKKKQKLAAKRNTIKRRLKEAYRINKLSLYNCAKEHNLSMHIMILQVTGNDVPYSTIEKKIGKAISKIVERELKKSSQV